MSPKGRPEGESLSAQREDRPVSATRHANHGLALLLYPEFAEYQVVPTLEALRGWIQLTVVGATTAPARGEAGLRVLPDIGWSNASQLHPTLALLPGALDMRAPATDPTLLSLLTRWAQAGTVLAAICGGPVILHAAGQLDGRRFTVGMSAEQRRLLGMDETRFTEQPVVVDGPLITAQGSAAIQFASACMRAMRAAC